MDRKIECTKDYRKSGSLEIDYVPSASQLVDTFTSRLRQLRVAKVCCDSPITKNVSSVVTYHSRTRGIVFDRKEFQSIRGQSIRVSGTGTLVCFRKYFSQSATQCSSDAVSCSSENNTGLMQVTGDASFGSSLPSIHKDLPRRRSSSTLIGGAS